jgi:hypothetical protein
MKKLFIEVYMLTVADCFCTGAGVYMGFIGEANPLLRSAVEAEPIFTCVSVCLVIGLLLWGIYRLGGKMRLMPLMILILIGFKIAVLGLHFCWISQVI